MTSVLVQINMFKLSFSGDNYEFATHRCKYAAAALLCSLIGTNELGLAQDVTLHGMFNV